MRTLLAVLVMSVMLGANGPSVKLKTSSQVSTAPTTLTFTVTIEPFEGNRKACLVIDGGEYQSSCWQVDGEKHPRTEWVRRRIGAEGEYYAALTLASIVCKDAEKRDCEVIYTTDTTQFLVTGPGVPFVR